MAIPVLQSLFAYKAWANAELFAALADLPADHAETLRACLRTLNHIYVVDRIFRAHLSGEARPYEATNTPQIPPLDALRDEVAATDAWYREYVAGLQAAEAADMLAFTFTDGAAGRMSREEMLMHVIAHGAYHRGNVGQMLKSIGLAPPRDLYTRFLHLREPARREP